MIEDVVEIDNLIPHQFLDDLHHYAQNIGSWNLQNSHPKYGKKRFLIMPLNKDPNLTGIINSLENKVNKKYIINRVYLNGQFYGMSGCPHTDSNNKNHYTLLTYVNPNWDITWGGQTIFYDKSWDDNANEIKFSDRYKVIYPQRNLSLLFPAQILHYAESPTRDCDELRITLAFKLEVVE